MIKKIINRAFALIHRIFLYPRKKKYICQNCLKMTSKFENHLLKSTMTYGLYLGVVFSLVVLLFHFLGMRHTPGDKSGLINALIMSFAMFYFGRKYRDQYFQGDMLYKQALGFAVLLSVFSAIIFAFFAYWYYEIISPEAINTFIEQIKVAMSETPRLSESQQNAIIELYEQALSPAIMAFAVGFNQVLSGVLIGLVVAVFIKSPLRIY